MNRFGDIDTSCKRLPPVYGYRSEKLVSLEKALEPIESHIDELPYYIKIAKKNCRFPSEHGLSKDQSAAIYIYTMEWNETSLYRVLNQALRSENRQALKIWFPYLKLFDTALNQLPTVKEVLWRGIPLDIGKSFTKNQLVTWWSVNSCSSSLDVIKAFLCNKKNSTLFLIEAMNGKRISSYTEFENEDEIILRMGTQFRVKSNALDHPDGSHVVHLIEIDDNDDESLASSTAAATTSYKGALDVTWKQAGTTVAGGNGQGNQLSQLWHTTSICIDDKDDQIMYISDCGNHRIVEWKCNGQRGKIVAGGNGRGNRTINLDYPRDIIIDRETNSFIICDYENRRVMRWSRQNNTENGEIIISDILCYGVTMDKSGSLYVSDVERNVVKRWKRGDQKGTIVAGGNGQGTHLHQLHGPTFIFVDDDYSLYVSDSENHRVMKWLKDAKEGIVVAGGNGSGNSSSQLYSPRGVIVDQLGQIYVADNGNHRVMRWCKGAKEGTIIVGGNGRGGRSNQLDSPHGLAFDQQGNLYVAEYGNERIQKFEIDS